MKIIYLIPGFYRTAGMERALALKADWLAGRGYEIVIVTTEQKGRPAAFTLDPSIRLLDLGIGYEDNNGSSFACKFLGYPIKLWRHRRRLSRLLKDEKADVVISMFGHDASFLPGIRDGSHKVLEVHFSREKRLQYRRGGLWGLTDRLRSRIDLDTARSFERFVVLTREDAALWGRLDNMTVIPNPRTFSCENPADLSSHQVIAAGRYSHQKGFERLVAAWRKIDTEGWVLRIAGDGKLGAELLEGENIVCGPSPDIKAEYLSSSIYALSSRYEGLPMVLLEAQASGLPCVSFDCKCGPKDIITDGVDGILVREGDTDGLAAGLERLMKDEGLRRKMGEAAFRNSENYDIEKIMPLWVKLLSSLQ